MDAAPAPVPDEVLADLRTRLRATRFVPLPPGVGWDRGTDAEYLADLVGYWATSYDWRSHEERIRSWPWQRAGSLRVIHQRAPQNDAPVVVLLHGWPDSVLRFEKVLPLLGNVHLVVPALPGYPFSAGEAEVGLSSARMGDRVIEALDDLGYQRVVLSGGDIGSAVAEYVASAYPDRLSALHLTDVPLAHALLARPDDPSEDEREYFAAVDLFGRREGAYALEHATKPHTIAAALGDSPAGLASWIVEKLRTWTDCGGDVESAFTREELLTWVTAYWVTGTIGTSFSPYTERRALVERVDVPTALTQFPHDLALAPREFVERIMNVQHFQRFESGGHFGAWERPDFFVAGVHAAVDLAS